MVRWYRRCLVPRANRHPLAPPEAVPVVVWVGRHSRFSHRKCPVPRVVTTAARTLLPIRATVFRSTTVEPRKVREARASTTRPPATRSNCSRPTARNHPTMTPRCSPRNPNNRRAPRRLPNNNSSSRPCSRNNSSHHSPTINEKPDANRSHKRWASLNRYSTWPVRAVHAQVDVFNLAETSLPKARGVLAPIHPMVQAAGRTLNRSTSTARARITTLLAVTASRLPAPVLPTAVA